MGLIQRFRNMPEKMIKYKGVFHDYSIDKKIFNLMHSSFKPKYIPEKYYKENGKYYLVEKKI